MTDIVDPAETGVPCLAVLLRGWMDIGVISEEFRDEVQRHLGRDSVVVVPDLNMGLMSMADPADLCASVDKLLTDLVKEHRPKKVVLIGFSTGTLIARGALLLAHDRRCQCQHVQDRTCKCKELWAELGESAEDREGCEQEKTWLDLLDRVVLIAGILRGWSVTSVTPFEYRWRESFLRLGAKVYSWLHTVWHHQQLRRRWTLGELTERGEPFVIDQRLRFEDAMECLQSIKFVYLMGTDDDFVSPADAIDIGPLKNFYFVELEGADHLTIVRPEEMIARADRLRDADERQTYSANREDREAKLKLALAGNTRNLNAFRLPDDHVDDYLDPLDLPIARKWQDKVKHAVIVLHGIRDHGFWTKRIGARIKGRTAEISIRTPTPTYGFFSILNFINRYSRYRKTKWFMEQYADVRTLFPRAEISFVGHSNGTYLAAHAMHLCKSIRFKRIYFAGSVVRSDYPWGDRKGQVGDKVVNVRAAKDMIVALAPGLLEWVRLGGWFNVGGGGYAGFREPGDGFAVENHGPFAGGHGVGVSDDFWKPIADFVNTGTFAPPPVGRGWWWSWAVIPMRLGVIAFVVTLIVFSVRVIDNLVAASSAEAIPTAELACVLSVTAIWLIVLRAAKSL